MKIKINSEGKRIRLWLPTRLFTSSLSFKLIEKALQKEDIHCSKETRDNIQKLLKQARKKYKGLCLVEVHSADGDDIEITL
ncbi:MAG: hypothetical protein EOM50_02815 [Erysipelotrichia bacterium]|nr:hypothetical protein [Erysipelotrichia bacterium]NCC54017.1 hypothetical protein [Erysipelotrichia bacterium]